MSEAPKITFCLPVFNATERIERCLQAIIAQQVPSREILVVDNASTDDTVAKAKRLLEGIPGARVEINQKNLGRIENWNRCLELARGRYLRFAMVNDVWLPGSAELLLHVARQHPEAVMVCSQARIVQQMENDPPPVATNPPLKIYQPLEMLRHICATARNDTDSLNTIIFRNDIIQQQQLRFDPRIPYWADFHFFIQMSAFGPVVYAQTATYLFDLGVKTRFAVTGQKIQSYYHEVRGCAELLAKLFTAHGVESSEGYGFLFWQYVSHPTRFEDAPLPGYSETWKLFRGAGRYRRQALKHRLNQDLHRWIGRTR